MSAIINVLFLGGPLYMLLIYDSVMPSGSTPTLFGLLALIVIVYLFQGIFDFLRSRVLSEVAASLNAQMTGRVHQLIASIAMHSKSEREDGLTPMRDLDSIRGFLSSPGPNALMDLPWLILFLALLTLLHFWLGVTTFLGALVLVALTVLQDRKTIEPSQTVSEARAYRSKVAQDTSKHIEVIQALGMGQRMRGRWASSNAELNAAQDQVTRTASLLSGVSRIFRLFLQSLVLTVGALLYLAGEASGGIVFAASILAARALAPIDQAMAHWPKFTEARQGWERLEKLLGAIPPDEGRSTQLPPPAESLAVDDLAIIAPGARERIIDAVSFRLEAGDALGVIGPSAAGKTTLCKALVALYEPARGSVRLDGASLSQWDADTLGQHLGFLPQQVTLFDGTIAQNIARFEPDPPSEEVIAAAKAAGVHTMILQLPQGYDTPIGAQGITLSAGQSQRIGLARSLYRGPFLIVLDEPNSNLDAEGEAALDSAIAATRKRGAIVVLVAHRPSALRQVNKVLVLQNGRVAGFGERDEILARLAKASSANTINAARELDTPSDRLERQP
ncbi:type I secretion system permease/ATPase [Erythrobacter sp. SCSIO 43205]|uniref:type I secretion system permease/ATPase n=1 Tax=Erythrobacter sp. SCSIO 43205 TaxID=2779361 RepID=UPI002102DE25|nr:type I secretion system permease/ATPase [Erythrobacter sp. SCSIO 43205]